jgi:hypothetical protein
MSNTTVCEHLAHRLREVARQLPIERYALAAEFFALAGQLEDDAQKKVEQARRAVGMSV